MGGMNLSQENINERIMIDIKKITQDVEDILDEIKILRSDKHFQQILGYPFVETMKEYDVAARNRLHDTFSIAVVGEFKRGKSTLINALLGDNYVPVAVTPETVCINRISYGEEPSVWAVLKNGKRARLSLDEIKREKLKELINELPAPIEYLDMSVNAEILKDICIIDTPGTGDIMNQFDEQVAQYLVNADALLYLVSARAPLSMTEQAYLSAYVMPQSFSKIMAIVNLSDTLETKENVENIRQFMEERIKAISPTITLYMISALDELCRKKGLKRPEEGLEDILETNFYAFENNLRQEIIMKKDTIKALRAKEVTKKLLETIVNRGELLKSTLYKQREIVAGREADIKQENNELYTKMEGQKKLLSECILQMSAEAKKWMYEFLSNVREEIVGVKSTVEVSDLERYFQFYLMDITKKGIMNCVEFHQVEIREDLLAAAKHIAYDISETFFGKAEVSIADCITDISWTQVDTAMVVGQFLGLSTIFGPLYIVGQAIAGFLRQKAVNKKQWEFLEPVLQEYDTMVQEVIKNVDDLYQKILKTALAKVDEIYENQVNMLKEAMDHTKQMMLNEDIKIEEVGAYIDEIAGKMREQIVALNDMA